MKKTLVTLALSALVLTSHSSNLLADGHKYCENKQNKQKCMAKHKNFSKNADHANFMPNIMHHLRVNQAKFNITDEQMQQLNNYHKQHSTSFKDMVKDLMWTENKAKQLALSNYPPQQVIEAGELSLKIRHDIMLRKLQCRTFVKSVLSPQQYKAALTSYQN